MGAKIEWEITKECLLLQELVGAKIEWEITKECLLLQELNSEQL